jgi:hypothetical protein
MSGTFIGLSRHDLTGLFPPHELGRLCDRQLLPVRLCFCCLHFNMRFRPPAIPRREGLGRSGF